MVKRILAALVLLTVTVGPAAAASYSVTVNQSGITYGDTVTFSSSFAGNPANYIVAGACVDAADHNVPLRGWQLSPSEAATTGVTMGPDPTDDSSAPWATAIAADCYGGLYKVTGRTNQQMATFSFHVSI